MLHIRLTRVGKKKQPTYRLIVTEKGRDPWGKALEILGHYNPRTKEKAAVLKTDRIKYWLEKGAQTSNTVHNLLLREGILSGKKKKSVKLSKKRSAKIEEKKKAAEAPAEPAPAAAEEKPAQAPAEPQAQEEQKTEKPAEEKEQEPEHKPEEPKTEEKPA